MDIVVALSGKWRVHAAPAPARLHCAGPSQAVPAAATGLLGGRAFDPADIAGVLGAIPDHFALVLETPEQILAAVDCIRSTPLFYAARDGRVLRVSNDARRALEALPGREVDPLSLLEARCAGYVTGDATLHQGLHQLLPGEFLLADKATGAFRLHRYYRYTPTLETEGDARELIPAMGAVLDDVFRRTAESAGGAPIYVPLSGGLDSRLVLAKLRELDYAPLVAFSYGMPGNREATLARQVADRLGVTWLDMSSQAQRGKRLFASPVRREYYRFADGLCATPHLSQFECLFAMREEGLLPDNAVLINGQSGDFITGAHISPAVLAPGAGEEDLIAAIMAKHYGLRDHLLTPENRAALRRKITNILAEAAPEENTPATLARAYEFWEWQERQCKLVVNDQRIYDFLGLEWRLPLWDIAFMRFCATIPLDLRVRQRLYVETLRAYDYRQVFTGIPLGGWSLTGFKRYWMKPLLTLSVLLSGSAVGRHCHALATYYHSYHNILRLFGLRYFLKHAGSSHLVSPGRGTLALAADFWLRENGYLDEGDA